MVKENIWIDLRRFNHKDELLAAVTTVTVQRLLVNATIGPLEEFGARFEIIYYVVDVKDLGKIPKSSLVIAEKEMILNAVKKQNFRCGLFVYVNDEKSLDTAWKSGIQYDYLVIQFKDQTNIPLELIIAQIEHKKAKTILLKVVMSLEDAMVTSQVLERGPDGIVLSDWSSDDLDKTNVLLEAANKVALSEVIVESIEYIGLGDRSCIDTVSLMGQDEGMIIGSTSNGGIMVCSETHYLPYMDLRPFRVNAGSVHSYVMAPENSTNYISELKAGVKLLCVNTKGEARVVAVGRSKT
ncbi:MAG: 3-dehydroquinate synthase II, partial [Lachnospiraceae bacterium]|nr:3-dehydroquinate synthase II [Lachnospiraceae bacterium]